MKKKTLLRFLNEKNKGKSTSINICKKLGFKTNFNFFFFPKKKLKFLRLKEINYSNLIRKKKVKNLTDLPSYKGLKHKNFYPVNGQKTRNNAKTRKKFKIF